MATDQLKIGGGFTEGELKVASFWVQNALTLKRLGYVILIAGNVFFWGYSLWGLLDGYLISYPRESKFTLEIANNQIVGAALDADRPRNISTGSATVLEGTDGRYDIAVEIENTNAQWWVEFNYRFSVSGETTPLRSGFVLPGHRTTLTELGFAPKARGGASAALQVDNVRWHRVDPKVVGAKYADYELNRSNISFENVRYNNTDVALATKTVGRSTFDVVNRGAYGYWAMDVVVKLYRGNTMVAINKITVPKITPGETRHVELDWFEKLPQITRTEIEPVVNYLDQSVYLPTGQFRTP